jgi:hypothetical protein
VEGELLQFAEGSPVTQGARLGFMWASPGQRRFLVRPRLPARRDGCWHADMLVALYVWHHAAYTCWLSAHTCAAFGLGCVQRCQGLFAVHCLQVLLHRVGLDEED